MPKRVSLKGKGADLFFGDYPAMPGADSTLPSANHDTEPSSPTTETASAQTPVATPATPPAPDQLAPSAQRKPRRPRREPIANTSDLDSILDSDIASAIASSRASTLATNEPDMVETIRQAIKAPGREVSFVRLTPEEKSRLGDIVYTFKRQGQKTSETEINRIAINYLLLDFREHGEQSVLARVLAALRA